MKLLQPGVAPGETVVVAVSSYDCENCGKPLYRVRMGPLGKEVYKCLACGILYLRNWRREPYFDAEVKR